MKIRLLLRRLILESPDLIKAAYLLLNSIGGITQITTRPRIVDSDIVYSAED